MRGRAAEPDSRSADLNLKGRLLYSKRFLTDVANFFLDCETVEGVDGQAEEEFARAFASGEESAQRPRAFRRRCLQRPRDRESPSVP